MLVVSGRVEWPETILPVETSGIGIDGRPCTLDFARGRRPVKTYGSVKHPERLFILLLFLQNFLFIIDRRYEKFSTGPILCVFGPVLKSWIMFYKTI